MSPSTVAILQGNTFVVSDRGGDIEASPTEAQGLFADDTRFLSKWVLTVNGVRPALLSTDDVQYFEAKFFLAPTRGTIYVDADLSIMRGRSVRRGFREEFIVVNHAARAIELEIRLDAAADFVDLFEVKDALKKKGETYRRVEGEHIVYGYKRESFVRETWIHAPGAALEESGLTFRLEIAPHGEWSTTIDVQVRSVAEGTSRSQDARVSWIRIAVSASSRSSRPPRGSGPTGRRSCKRTSGASSTSPRSDFTPCSRRVDRCPRPGSPGSWRSSGATAS